MSIKEQVSPEQWKALMNAPGAAAAYVSTASGGLMDMVQETFTASKFIQESISQAGQSSYGATVDELLSAMKAMTLNDAKANAHPYQSKDQTGLRAEAKQLVVDGYKAAATLPAADGYKRWILDMARKVAETKTGGILGFGGKSVIDDKEQAAIDELAALMTV
jgi:hypothetical protein